jgi:signal transduction histidine kinase
MSIANDERQPPEERLRSEQHFLRQLLHAHERDRKLTAYEIHDGLLQYVSGALLHLETLANLRPPLAGKGRDALELATHLLRRSIDEGRRVMSGLRPPILDEEGIVMAVEYLVVEKSEHGKLHVDFTHNVTFDRLDPLLEGTIFRIVQEALHNVQRHSRATKAEVKLIQHDGRLRIEVYDNGVGFAPDEVADDRFGVAGIRKRAALFGGEAQIVSSPGQGTRVVVDMPLVGTDLNVERPARSAERKSDRST